MTPLRTIAALLATTTAFAITSCSTSDPDGEGADVVNSSSPAANADEAGEKKEAESKAGTRENPVAAGTEFTLGDWTVTLAKTNTDATQAVKNENEFNEIAEGRQAVMVEVTAMYIGSDSGEPLTDLLFGFYGNAGNTFGIGQDDYCGVIPQPFNEQGETFPDASVTGSVCVAVPSGQVEGGAWIVEDPFNIGGKDRVFVALK